MISNAIYIKVCQCLVYSIMLAVGLATYADASAVYRWISPSGVVSYGSSPPSGAQHVVIISGVRSSDKTTMIPRGALTLSHNKAKTSRSTVAKSESLVKLKADRTLARNALIQAIRTYKHVLNVRTGNEHNYAKYQSNLRSMKNNVTMDRLRLDIIQKDIITAEHIHSSAATQ